MAISHFDLRKKYLAAFLILFAVEVFIALFVHDPVIRPYGGDVLVTVLICCFVRIFAPQKLRLLPAWVFLFSAAVEIGQYFDFVALLGLGEIRFFRVLLGNTFSVSDLFCYAFGCVLFYIGERLLRKS